MTSARTSFLVFLIISGCIAGGLWWKTRPVSLCRNLECIHVDGISSFLKKDIYSDTAQTYRALFSDGTRFLRIEALYTSSQSALQELDAAISKVKAMYEKAPAPYPGEISDAIVCDPRFVPTYEETGKLETKTARFVGYLNNRMTFGSCSQDQAVYRGILTLTYCPRLSLLLRVELITPVSDFAQHENELIHQMKSLRCGK